MSQTTTLDDLLSEEKRVDAILREMKNEEYSILELLGTDRILSNAKQKAFLCRKILKKVTKEMDKHGLYRKNVGCGLLLKELRRYLPVEFHHDRPKLSDNETNIFIIENPSLGEIIRMIGIIISRYRSDVFLPIDLEWYETFLPFLETLNILGVHPMPFISESLKGQILENQDEASWDNINRLSEKLLAHCLNYYRDIAFSKTMIILPFETGISLDPTSRRKREMLMNFMASLPEKAGLDYCNLIPIYIHTYHNPNLTFNVFCIEKFYRCEKMRLSASEQKNFEKYSLYSELLSRIDRERLKIESK